jgi:hypothetical protein
VWRFFGTQQLTNGIALGACIVAAISLWFLFRYVRTTEALLRASLAQTEATLKPAVVAMFSDEHAIRHIRLANIGNGPAVAVSWRATESNHQATPIAYIEAGGSVAIAAQWDDWRNVSSYDAKTGKVSELKNPAQTRHSIICSYGSLANCTYESTTQLDFFLGTTGATFRQLP